jgi:hypothetical protein
MYLDRRLRRRNNGRGERATRVTSEEDVEEAELQADLAMLEHVRASRKQFLDQICEQSRSIDDDVLATLRLESTYLLAEFLFLLRSMQITTVPQIEHFAELHNAHMVRLSKDPDKMARYGLTRDRILDAIFTGDTLPRLLRHWGERPGALDQSNLARFLVTLMSAETCRKIVVACEKAGYLTRHRLAGGATLVHSEGTLEALFGACLRSLRRQVMAGA